MLRIRSREKLGTRHLTAFGDKRLSSERQNHFENIHYSIFFVSLNPTVKNHLHVLIKWLIAWMLLVAVMKHGIDFARYLQIFQPSVTFHFNWTELICLICWKFSGYINYNIFCTKSMKGKNQNDAYIYLDNGNMCICSNLKTKYKFIFPSFFFILLLLFCNSLWTWLNGKHNVSVYGEDTLMSKLPYSEMLSNHAFAFKDFFFSHFLCCSSLICYAIFVMILIKVNEKAGKYIISS